MEMQGRLYEISAAMHIYASALCVRSHRHDAVRAEFWPVGEDVVTRVAVVVSGVHVDETVGCAVRR